MNTSLSLPAIKLRATADRSGPFAGRFSVLFLCACRAPVRFITEGLVAPLLATTRGFARGLGLALLTPLALADGLLTPLLALPTTASLARARAAWLHRWSRGARFLLGLRTTTHGHAPVSGVIVANYHSLLDAIVLAAIHPCVFVAGEEVRRHPFIGLLARFAGTISVRSTRRVDLQLATFAIERAIQRRQIVVLFPECNPTRGFTTALFHPASEIGCSLTATAIRYGKGRERTPSIASLPTFPTERNLAAHLAKIITRRQNPVTVTFDDPRFHHGHRKHLAHQLRDELSALDPAAQS